MAGFNWVDYIVLALLLMSIGAGALRGFVREVIAVIAWFVGIFVASRLAVKVASYFTSTPSVQSSLASASDSIGFNTAQPVSYLAIGISFICIFIVVLIIGKIFSYFFASAIRLGGMSFIDGVLGAIFGLIRGILLVIVLMFLVQLTPAAEEPYWGASYFVHKFQPGVQWISNQVMPGLLKWKVKADDAWQNLNNRTQTLYNE